MADDQLDKKHDATGKRLEDLRKKGQVMRSRDLSGGLILIAGIILIIFMQKEFQVLVLENFKTSFSNIKDILLVQNFPGDYLKNIAVKSFMLLIPLFSGLLLVTLLSPFLFGGWNFTWNALEFKLEKFNIITNIQNLFSPKRIGSEIIKSLLKVSFVMGVFVYYFYGKKNDIHALTSLSAKSAIYSSGAIIQQFISTISIAIVFLMAFDMLYTYFQFHEKSKMSGQEVKDEHKNMEGNAEVKRKLKSAQFALLRQRLSQTVPQAHVIVTNPTHYAVALRYHDKKDKAPRVMAKGTDEIALQIRILAAANGIPIYQAPLLARAIYHSSKINQEISPELYMAVAIVLSYVNQLKNYQQGIGRLPTFVSDLEIPQEFIYDE